MLCIQVSEERCEAGIIKSGVLAGSLQKSVEQRWWNIVKSFAYRALYSICVLEILIGAYHSSSRRLGISTRG